MTVLCEAKQVVATFRISVTMGQKNNKNNFWCQVLIGSDIMGSPDKGGAANALAFDNASRI